KCYFSSFTAFSFFDQIDLLESGEHVLGCCGEVHLERCINDLQQLYSKVPLKDLMALSISSYSATPPTSTPQNASLPLNSSENTLKSNFVGKSMALHLSSSHPSLNPSFSRKKHVAFPPWAIASSHNVSAPPHLSSMVPLPTITSSTLSSSTSMEMSFSVGGMADSSNFFLKKRMSVGGWTSNQQVALVVAAISLPQP
ncbi:hypothetical protein IE077_001357, partial [Cardiosporidium cionae]